MGLHSGHVTTCVQDGPQRRRSRRCCCCDQKRGSIQLTALAYSDSPPESCARTRAGPIAIAPGRLHDWGGGWDPACTVTPGSEQATECPRLPLPTCHPAPYYDAMPRIPDVCLWASRRVWAPHGLDVPYPYSGNHDALIRNDCRGASPRVPGGDQAVLVDEEKAVRLRVDFA